MLRQNDLSRQDQPQDWENTEEAVDAGSGCRMRTLEVLLESIESSGKEHLWVMR